MTTITWTDGTQTEVPHLTVLPPMTVKLIRPSKFCESPPQPSAEDNHICKICKRLILPTQVKPPKHAAKKRTPKRASHSNYCDCKPPKPDAIDKKVCVKCDRIIAEK